MWSLKEGEQSSENTFLLGSFFILFLWMLSGTCISWAYACIEDLPEGALEVEAVTWIEQALKQTQRLLPFCQLSFLLPC